MVDAATAGRGCPPWTAVLLAAAWLAAPAHAKDEPLWEYGFGIGVLGYNDYRGAESSHVFPVPVPYLVYNGPLIKADKEGVRGALFSRPWVDLNLSFDATLPVSNDRTRNGMTELKPTAEAGLQFDLHVWRSEDSRIKLVVRVPLREAFTFQAPPRSIGTTLTPGLKLKADDPWDYDGWEVRYLHRAPCSPTAAITTIFIRYRRKTRPPPARRIRRRAAMPARNSLPTYHKRFPHYWFGAFVRYDNLSGAVFEDSPLVRQENYWSAGFAFAWMIGRSSTIVQVAD